MIAMGMSLEAALEVVEAFESPASDARKERNKRYYESHKGDLKRLNSDAHAKPSERLKASENRLNSVDAPRAHVEDKSLTAEIEHLESKKDKTPKGDLVDFQNEFIDLDADRLQALVKHRRSKRAQNTGHAAKLFRKDAEACGLTMAQAVDTCISRNWITIKPEWLTPNQRGSPKGPTLSERFAQLGQFANERQNGNGLEAPQQAFRLVPPSPADE